MRAGAHGSGGFGPRRYLPYLRRASSYCNNCGVDLGRDAGHMPKMQTDSEKGKPIMKWKFNTASNHCWRTVQDDIWSGHVIYGLFREDGSHFFQVDYFYDFATLSEAKSKVA